MGVLLRAAPPHGPRLAGHCVPVESHNCAHGSCIVTGSAIHVGLSVRGRVSCGWGRHHGVHGFRSFRALARSAGKADFLGFERRRVLPARGCGPLYGSLVEAEARRSRQTGCPCFVTVTLVTTSHGEAEMAKVADYGIFDWGEGRQRQDGVGGVYRFSGVSPRRGGWDGPSALLV